ncbi:MAG: TolB protein, partial [Solirubrobacteraceae bacterium]|nr:TolB protein [Solirubrobacteraceae bacterium]
MSGESGLRPALLGLAALLAAAFASPAFAQRPDDSYKGPAAGGGLDSQLRQFEPAPPPPAGGGAGGGLRGGTTAGGGLQGRQTQGTIAPIPLAIPVFLGPDPKLAADIADVVQSDLGNSGLFEPLDRGSFLDQIRDVNAAPRFPDWRSIRADALVVGDVERGADGRIVAQFRLWDVASGRQLAGQRFATSAQNWRRVGHIIADQVYKQLTGESGYFDTRVVFIDETGPKERRRKRLAIMDQDGQNVRYLTRGDELVVTPRFSPSSQDVTYMSFGQGDPRVYLLNIETGQREVVGNFPGMTFAPRFSPDGQRIVMSLTQGTSSNLYAMDLRSRNTTRL